MADVKLTDLVTQIDQDRLVIPEFQRGFKWRVNDIRKLLESLLLDYPIGAALFWRTQRGALEFRRVEDVQFEDGDDDDQEDGSVEATRATEEIDFILDGQQRITSIYKLFPATLACRDSELESRLGGLRFFLDLRLLGLPLKPGELGRHDFTQLSDADNVSAAIIEKKHSDLRRDFRQVKQGPAPQKLTEENILDICIDRFWLPLSRNFLDNKFSHLQRLIREASHKLSEEYQQQAANKSQHQIRKEIDEGLDRWSDWFTSTFAGTLNRKALTCLILGNDKPEGLARIFETINSTGMSLSVFDLLVARVGSWDVNGARTNLRKVIYEAVDRKLLQRFDDDRALGGSATQQIPRLLALRAGIELRKGEILNLTESESRRP